MVSLSIDTGDLRGSVIEMKRNSLVELGYRIARRLKIRNCSDSGGYAMRLLYRSDIDGMRAIAVMAVALFHAFPKVLPGGFVGVDASFVISGYLITSIIVRDLDGEGYSFADFYARRVRRLFSALIVVLVATLAAGFWILLPSAVGSLAKDAVASAVLSANLIFWWETGYFDIDAKLKPLLHLWSLGIEEQFYLAWPLALWLTPLASEWP